MDINPSEITKVIKDQIKNVGEDAEVSEVGQVLSVGDGIARIYGLDNVEAGEMVEFSDGSKGMALNLESDNVGVVIFGDDKVTTGAASDIEQATKRARAMVMRAGLSKEMGPVAYGENEEEVFLGRSVTKQQNMSEETARKVDSEVKKIVDKGYERARAVLTEKIDDLHKIAKALLIYETLSGDEIRDLIIKDIKPTRSFKEEENEDGKSSSALGSLGLKPKPAI